MATVRQKKAVEALVENHGVVSRAMITAGYELNTAKNPKNLTESKGYKELLKENGLDEQFITKALVSDIIDKPRKRFFELNLGAEILGMKKKLDNPNPSVVILNISSEAAKKYDIIQKDHETNPPSIDNNLGLPQV